MPAKARDAQRLVEELLGSGADAIALVAHNQVDVLRIVGGVNILPLHIGAEIEILGILEEVGKVLINDIHSGETAHRSLYYFWVVEVCGVFAANDLLYPEPVCQANDGTEITWVLYAIQHDIKAAVSQVLLWNFSDGYGILRVLEEGDFLELVSIDSVYGCIDFVQRFWVGRKYFFDFNV